MTIEKALSRTMLLMRDDINDDATDHVLLDALLTTTLAIIVDEKNLNTHSAQSCVVAMALLMARSGATIYLNCPDIQLAGAQPPLSEKHLVTALLGVNNLIVPKTSFITSRPTGKIDAAFILGDSEYAGNADLVFRLNASDWSATISDKDSSEWSGSDWPVGGLAAAGFAAAEAFKASMRKLRKWRKADVFDDYFAPVSSVCFKLEEEGSAKVTDLTDFDFISAGAITHAALFVLARLPNIRGRGRVIDSDENDISNSNRYSLLTLDRLLQRKALDISHQKLGDIELLPINMRFDEESRLRMLPLASNVLVGVDHIPTRWLIQKHTDKWLGIGATSHYSSMTTYHEPGLPCAKCAHPRDDVDDAPIPTLAVVSFWAGLLLAVNFIRHLAKRTQPEQQTWLWPLRADSGVHLSHVHARKICDCSFSIK